MLETEADVEGAVFVAKRMELKMGRITLASAALPECQLGRDDQMPFAVAATFGPRPAPLLINVDERLDLTLDTTRELDDNVLRITTGE